MPPFDTATLACVAVVPGPADLVKVPWLSKTMPVPAVESNSRSPWQFRDAPDRLESFAPLLSNRLPADQFIVP